MEPYLIDSLIIPLAGMATGIILGLPVVRVIVKVVDRKLGGSSSPGDLRELRADVDRLTTQLGGVEDIAHRVAELEERIDFTERVLAQERARPGLPHGE
jgi:hypothetical protein